MSSDIPKETPDPLDDVKKALAEFDPFKSADTVDVYEMSNQAHGKCWATCSLCSLPVIQSYCSAFTFL